MNVRRNKENDIPSSDESLAEIAYRQIEDLIVTMQLKPGAWISEAEIVAQLRLGRTPVREALQRLAVDQLLQSRPRRGMVVPEIDVQAQLKLLEVRRPLEIALVRAAARRRTEADVDLLKAVLAEFRRDRGDPDHPMLLRINRRFVAQLVVCARNPFLRHIMPLQALSRRFWVAYETRQQHFSDTEFTDYQIDIGEAVIKGDEKEAERCATVFLDRIEQFALFTVKEFMAE